jgi:(4S)-4-hydroxy-5-phosphonooxypentane-2,3-dione isomerase
MTQPFVILVEFKLKSKSDMGRFRKLIDENARESCRSEPGCWRFDVLLPQDAEDSILLYEIYQDRAAFDLHLQSPHFHDFNRDSAALVEGKTITEFSLACEGSQGATASGVH